MGKSERRHAFPQEMMLKHDREYEIVEYLKQYYADTSWEDSLRYTYTYDNNLAEIIYQHKIGSNFVNYGKQTYHYNANNLLSSTMYYNFEDNSWIGSYRYDYLYDNDGIITTSIYSEWINNGWLSTYMGTYSYEDGNLALEFWRYWEDEDTLVNSHQYSYSYDVNDNLTELVYQIYENGTALQNVYRYLYSYNDDNLNTIFQYQIWENADYQNSYRYVYYYDMDGYLVHSDYQTWGSDWINNSYSTYFYDENDNLVQILWQYWYQNELYYYTKEVLSYEDFNSVEEFEIPEMNVRNYPNPFNSETTISFETTNSHKISRIEIFNVKGQKVKSLECNIRDIAASTKLMYSITWNGKNEFGKDVSPGIYYMKIKDEDYRITRKMLKVR